MIDQTRILCVLARERSLADYAPGTINTRTCSQCGERVLLAPSSQKLLASDPTIELVCFGCVELKPDDTHDLAPGAEDEVRDFLKKGAH